MKSSTLKKEIHQAVDVVNDNEILYAIYTILKKNSGEDEWVLTSVQKKELDKRLAEHKSGKLKYYTLDEVKKSIKKSIRK
jgi:putative addiction module component (TIGR02574 family)